MGAKNLVFSIVSHMHGDLVVLCLNSLSTTIENTPAAVKVLLTLNVPEPHLEKQLKSRDWPFDLVLMYNPDPKGFGANHNQGFNLAMSQAPFEWFVVMNPDIYWQSDSANFWLSLCHRVWPSNTGLLCPQQLDISGAPQDFARKLLTPWGLALRVLRRLAGLSPSGVAASVEEADWVNGACMVWRGQAFEALGGFDERFFMYCEDTDLCLRARLAGWRMQSAGISVIHDARRQTVRSWRHLKWHLVSLARLWTSGVFWRYVLRKPSSGSANATL